MLASSKSSKLVAAVVLRCAAAVQKWITRACLIAKVSWTPYRRDTIAIRFLICLEVAVGVVSSLVEMKATVEREVVVKREAVLEMESIWKDLGCPIPLLLVHVGFYSRVARLWMSFPGTVCLGGCHLARV